MKVKTKDIINIGDVSSNGFLRLDSLFNILQEKAFLHMHTVGIGLKDMLESHNTWILNRVAVEILKLPKLEETIDVDTWSRKIYRFKGLRDYEVFADGESVIRATSLWVYFDTEKGRPVRAPDYFAQKFGAVEEQATEVDIESMKFKNITKPHACIPIATRISDYDINGHVNNAAILQYIETGIYRSIQEKGMINRIQLVFQNEIPFDLDQVEVQVETTDNGCLFEVQSQGMVFVRGAATIKTLC